MSNFISSSVQIATFMQSALSEWLKSHFGHSDVSTVALGFSRSVSYGSRCLLKGYAEMSCFFLRVAKFMYVCVANIYKHEGIDQSI